MRKRVWWRRLALVLTLPVVATLLSTALTATPASANTLYPGGCAQYTKNSWSTSCWVGYNYVKYSVSVLAVQYVLFDVGANPGVPDCDFGSNTDAATIRYQDMYGFTRDGIVGSQTWTYLQGELEFSGYEDQYGLYYNVRDDGVRFYYQNQLLGSWFVYDPYTTGPENGHIDYIGINVGAGTGYWCP